MPMPGRAPIGAGKGFAGKAGAVGGKPPVGASAGKGAAAGGRTAAGTKAPAPSAAPTTKRPFGMFGTMRGVQGPSGGGNWIKPGEYYLMVNKFTADVSKNGKGEFCAAEFTVLMVNVGFDDSNTVGERVSALFMSSTPNNMGVINMKGFLGACCGMDPNATDPSQNGYASEDAWEEAGIAAADGDGTVLAGTILKVIATAIKTKAQKDFTKVMYEGLSEEETAEVLAATGAAAE